MFVWDTTDVELRVAAAVLALIVPMPAHLLGFVECHRNKRDQSCGGIGRCLASRFHLALLRGLLVPWLSACGSATPARQLLKGASMIAMTVTMLVLGAWLIFLSR
jgi:hypothetical protein